MKGPEDHLGSKLAAKLLVAGVLAKGAIAFAAGEVCGSARLIPS